ncbi:MAG TPA: hypothetical protein VK843_20735 [Planctomycetota bacterium]|nr:hypothetical protein [Planctomycetota bacterium]
MSGSTRGHSLTFAEREYADLVSPTEGGAVMESRTLPAEQAPTGPSTATFVLWVAVMVAGFLGAIIPAVVEASKFANGYYYGNDYPIPAFLSTILLAAFLVLFALANALFRLGVRWRNLFLALGIQLLCWTAGQAIVNGTFKSIVEGSVARAQRVVDAIHDYETEHGCAPSTLNDLVPRYFPSDPSWVHEGTTLGYYITSTTRPIPVGEWAIYPNPLEYIGLTYAPLGSGRHAMSGERLIGDWVVNTRGP